MKAWLMTLRHIGRRGVFLLLLAALDFLYSASLFDPASPNHRFNLILPFPAWASIWAFVGVILVIGAFTKSDKWAFAFAAGLKFAWAFLFGEIWLVGGYSYGWVAVAIWLVVAGIVILVAGWPESENGEVIVPKGPRA
jgi:hypothetical protein